MQVRLVPQPLHRSVDQDVLGPLRAKSALADSFCWFDSATQACTTSSMSADRELGVACGSYPHIGLRIARAEPQCFVDMGLSFLGATDKILGQSEEYMNVARLRSSAKARSHSAMP